MKYLELQDGIRAVVDDADYEKVLAQPKWFAHKPPSRNIFYVVHNIRGPKGRTTETLHRFLLKPSQGQLVDHINGNGLDNRRTNLRLCSPSENQRNRHPNAKRSIAGFKGVFPNGVGFTARIWVVSQYLNLGTYSDPSDAAKAYDAAAVKYFGEFAKLNFPSGGRSR